MKVRYDSSLKIAGIGIVPWPRLGPQRWFKNYKVFTYLGWDLPSSTTELHALSDYVTPLPILERLNSQRLLEEPLFQEMLLKNAPDYKLVTYKPLALPSNLSSYKALHNMTTVTSTFENKAWFRENFPELPFAPYKTYLRTELASTVESFNTIMNGRTKVVLQDEHLSGGKGTHIISSFKDFKYALDVLERMSEHTRVIVSDMLESATEVSVQACVTSHGIFTGPLQKQIISDPQLSNSRVPDGDKFCGIEVGGLIDQGVSSEVKALAVKVGKYLEETGYKGIFGIDCLVKNNQVFLLEVNPRLTGATPLLTMIYKKNIDVPFYLLHLLELSESQYEVEEIDDIEITKGALVLLHGQNDFTSSVESAPASGLYKVNANNKLDFFHTAISFEGNEDNTDLVLVQEYVPKGHRLKPGGRIVNIYFPYTILDSDNQILPHVREVIESAYSMIELKVIKEQ